MIEHKLIERFLTYSTENAVACGLSCHLMVPIEGSQKELLTHSEIPKLFDPFWCQANVITPSWDCINY